MHTILLRSSCHWFPSVENTKALRHSREIRVNRSVQILSHVVADVEPLLCARRCSNNACMDGMHGKMACMHACMDGIHAWIACMDGWHACMNGWMDGWMDGWMACMHGRMDDWMACMHSCMGGMHAWVASKIICFVSIGMSCLYVAFRHMSLHVLTSPYVTVTSFVMASYCVHHNAYIELHYVTFPKFTLHCVVT